MANINKLITLTERNDAGPYFDVLYSTDCISYFIAIDGNDVYLPTAGSTVVVTVPEETICIKLTSEGQCTNSVISGSTTTTTTSTTSTTSTTTAPTTTTTTTTTVATTKYLEITGSNNTGINFNQSSNDIEFRFSPSGKLLRLNNIPTGNSYTSSTEVIAGTQTINTALNLQGVTYDSIAYTSSISRDGSLISTQFGVANYPTTAVTIGHGLFLMDVGATWSLDMEMNTGPTTTTTTTTTFACSEYDLFCPSNAAGGTCTFEVDCCDGSTVTYQMPADSNITACVIAGGSVNVLSLNGIATPQGFSCSSDCGDVTTTTTTTTTQANCITNFGAGMTPCFGGTVDDYMEAEVNLQNAVSIDTTFTMRVYYIPGTAIGNCDTEPTTSIDIDVTVPAGETGYLVTCGEAPFIDAGGATICGFELIDSPFPMCTTTTTTTTTTINPADCQEWLLECRSGAVGNYCSFSYQDCNGVYQSVILPADTDEFVCALQEPSRSSTSGGVSGPYGIC